MPENNPIDSETSKEFSYTSRETLIAEINPEVKELIKKVKESLERLLESYLPPLSKANEDEKAEIQKQLDKIDSLKRVLIPTKDGDKIFYSLADSAGGVTEKTCLIDEDTLKTNLQELAKAQKFEGIQQNKIRMNAILKHPKAGKDTEVQREAIGLKIGRMLGFRDVTESTLVNHDTGNGQHPCLFVPFGQMELLTPTIEHADSMKGRLKKEHFQSVEDFGKYSAFFMLCSDPDFIGKAGQNKGLTGDGPKRLYMFDQVFMTDSNLGLDRSFNLVPTNLLSKLPNFIARHFMGRNKSVVNDSSFEEKVQGAIGLLQKKEDIQQMFQDVILANSNKPDDPLVKVLQKDAKECLKSFNARIGSIQKLFPSIKVNGEPKQIGDLVRASRSDDKSASDAAIKNLELLKKSMLVTQLINKPQLFDKSGKPYRAPFFTNPSTSVKGVSFNNDEVTISFSRRFGPPLSETKKATLRQFGFTISEDGKSATISQEGLRQLNEQSYFKEQDNSFDLDHKYIDSKKIDALAQTYKEDDDNVDMVKRLASYLSKSKNQVFAI
ncbi:MAG: hypothetical protein O2793_17335, partial [Proteobacteria bacterium]|nr:hypothetical protein [Pseudomonadota bacterium]